MRGARGWGVNLYALRPFSTADCCTLPSGRRGGQRNRCVRPRARKANSAHLPRAAPRDGDALKGYHYQGWVGSGRHWPEVVPAVGSVSDAGPTDLPLTTRQATTPTLHKSTLNRTAVLRSIRIVRPSVSDAHHQSDWSASCDIRWQPYEPQSAWCSVTPDTHLHPVLTHGSRLHSRHGADW